MKFSPSHVVLLFLAVLLLPCVASADSLAVGVVSDASAVQGTSFVADVNISGAADVYSFQFDLLFDPTILAISDVVEGAFLSGSGATFFFPGIIDNAAGNVTFTADTLETAIAGANGNGTLVEFRFNTIGQGTSSLNLDNVILLDSQLNLISSATANGRVTVTSGGGTVPTPEPSTLAFLAAGILPIVLRRFRR